MAPPSLISEKTLPPIHLQSSPWYPKEMPKDGGLGCGVWSLSCGRVVPHPNPPSAPFGHDLPKAGLWNPGCLAGPGTERCWGIRVNKLRNEYI